MPHLTGPIDPRFGPVAKVLVAPCLPGAEGPGIDPGQPHATCGALLDTGMGLAMVARRVVETLNIAPYARTVFGGCSFYGGTQELEIACLRIAFEAGAKAWQVPAGIVESFGDGSPYQVCLGQAFLRHVSLVHDGPLRTFVVQWPARSS